MKKLIVFVFLFTLYSQCIFTQSIGINTSGTAPDASAMLDVQSTTQGMLVPRMTTSQRLNISSPANGLLVYDTSTGGFWYRSGGAWLNLSIPNELKDADGDTKIQVEENTNDNQIRFDIAGEERIVFKENASGELMIDLSHSGANTFMGRDAGLNNNSNVFPNGFSNTFVGAFSGKSNTTGNYNTYIGRSSGSDNQTGDHNAFFGAHAGENLNGANSNTLLGYSSGSLQTSGEKNTYVGRSAGGLKPSGNENTLIGYYAGRSNSNGSGNVMIGYSAGSNSASSNNKLYIDNSSTNNPLIYGEFDNDLLRANGQLEIKTSAGNTPLKIDLNGLTIFKINSNGGIRNSSSAATFAIQLQNSTTDLVGRGQAFSWNTFSDRRIKSNFRPLEYGLSTILQLQPQSYDHHDSEYYEDGRVVMRGSKTSKDIGLVAQDVYELVPEAVSPPANEEELWSMDYTRLVPVLIKAIQEQQTTINVLSQKVEQLETQLKE